MASEKILLVDDEPHVLEGYRRSLHKQFNLETASSAREALEKMQRQGPYAVVVADMRMPDMSGLELFERLREMFPETPRIMLTGDMEQKTVADAVNRGAVYRFLNKPCSTGDFAAMLLMALEHYREQRETRLEAEQAAKKVDELNRLLDQQARRDALTGMLTRHTFELELKELLATPGEAAGCVLCCIDIDRFHVVNDTCGYAAGDEALRQFARFIKAVARSGTLLARASGNRFFAILQEKPDDGSGKSVDLLMQLLVLHLFEWEGVRFELGASIGTLPIEVTDEDASTLLNRVEVACLIAKDKGGRQLYAASASDSQLGERLENSFCLSRIQAALRVDHFVLYRQPIVPVDERQQGGEHFEILVRMLGDQQEPIPPGRFMQAAEYFQLMPQIDRWVVEHAFKWLGRRPGGAADIAVASINLSGQSIGDASMADWIVGLADKLQLDVRQICFEITETAAIADLNAAIRFIRQLHAHGFRFALDDFGVGLSSFSYLKSLPVDYVKIDGGFIRYIEEKTEHREMVKAINEIAKVMGKQTIAEYVESQQILDVLQEIGVDFVQGYHLGRPEPLWGDAATTDPA